MDPMFRNFLAILAGIIVGGVVNMGIVVIGPSIIPLPEGVDPTNVESLKVAMPSFSLKHYIMPFLAHALGTLAGAYTTVKIAVAHHMKLALGIGAFYLMGGIVNAQMIQFPLWFSALDLLGAYLPMGWLAGKLDGKTWSGT
ncbi:MAG: hypothetical protein AAFP19_01025 [Bacteroidota bacterium]